LSYGAAKRILSEKMLWQK